MADDENADLARPPSEPRARPRPRPRPRPRRRAFKSGDEEDQAPPAAAVTAEGKDEAAPPSQPKLQKMEGKARGGTATEIAESKEADNGVDNGSQQGEHQTEAQQGEAGEDQSGAMDTPALVAPVAPPRRRRGQHTPSSSLTPASSNTDPAAPEAAQPATTPQHDSNQAATVPSPRPRPRPRPRKRRQFKPSIPEDPQTTPSSDAGGEGHDGAVDSDLAVADISAEETPELTPHFQGAKPSFSLDPNQQDADELMEQDVDSDSSDEEQDSDNAAGEQEQEEDEATKKARKRYKCVAEVVSTEQSYVESLGILTNLFLARLEQARVPKHVLQHVFSNVRSLYDLHSRFLRKLERRIRKWREEGEDNIGDIFESFAPRFKAYTEYSINFEKSNTLLEERLKRDKVFADTVAECEREEACGFLKLDAFLLEPIQRLPRFRLLLTEYLKYTPEDHPDHHVAKSALDQIMAVTSEVNEGIRQQENSQKMRELQNKLEGVRIFKRDRKFLMEGHLQKMCRRGPQPRVVLLFSDMLLYAREQTTLTTQYVSARCISLQGTEVRACSLADGLYGIEVKSKTKSFMLCTPSPSDQHKWVEAIREAVEKDRQVRHSRFPTKTRRATRTDRFGETAPVWIPDHDVSMCQICAAEFSFVRRRHHCRGCGKVVCAACSADSIPLPYLANELGRVCPECFERYTKSSGKQTAALLKTRKQSRRKRTVERQQSIKAVTSSKLHRPLDLHERFIVQSSYAFEQGKFRKQKRWLLLRSDGVLFTFKAHSDPIASNTLPVLSYRVERVTKGEGGDKEFGIRLYKPGVKDFTFFCEQEDQAARWAEALQAAVVSDLPEWFEGEVYSGLRGTDTALVEGEEEEAEAEAEAEGGSSVA